MTDPRDAMLAAARALHERADWDPSICPTCKEAWPCDTAVALGATGRSEWATPEPRAAGSAEPDGQCAAWSPWDTTDGKHTSRRCSRPTEHTGHHTDDEGHQW